MMHGQPNIKMYKILVVLRCTHLILSPDPNPIYSGKQNK